MSIITTMTKDDFTTAMGHDFSYDAQVALYEYYDHLSDDTGEPFEFDRVAIRSEWYEYDSVAEAYKESGFESDDDSDDMDDESKLEVLNENTTVIELDYGHVLVGVF